MNDTKQSLITKDSLKSINKGNVLSLQKGKIPPQAVDLEEVVLGAMMIDKKGVDQVIDVLKPEAFYKEAHKCIYQAILDLFQKPEAIDIMTVSAQLKKNETLEAAGGNYYLIQLTKKVASSAHIEFHARVVLQKYLMRSLINLSSEIIEEAYDESTDVFDLLDSAESKLYDVALGNIKQSTESAQNLVIRAKKNIEEIAKKEGISGVPSGFTKLDALTSGWQPSDLIIMAARPGMGKTAMSLTMARNIAANDMPVAFFSLEMSSLQLITRLISSETGLNSSKLRTGKLEKHEWELLNMKVKTLESLPLYIDDTPSISIFDLRAKARRMASQYGIKMIMIDYLQLVTANVNNKGGTREQEVSTISRNLKALAKELNIPIIALSQLSRGVESRASGSKRPQLSDLRESGAIEQDADIVSFIYRPEYYKIETWDDEEGSPTQGQGELIIAKHRNGALDDIRLKFIGELGKFEDLSIGAFGMSNEIPSKINREDSQGFDPSNLPSAQDAFSNTSQENYSDDNDTPF